MASRFYVLMLVVLTGIVGIVSPPSLFLITAQGQTTTQDNNAEDSGRVRVRRRQFTRDADAEDSGRTIQQYSDADELGSLRELRRQLTRDADAEGLGLVKPQGQTIQDRKAEADKLFNQGNQQFQISQFEAAFQSWQ